MTLNVILVIDLVLLFRDLEDYLFFGFVSKIKESGYPGKEFAVEHREEMEEIAEKLA